MSDYLPDTPVVGRAYCPGCEPDADPSREVLDTRWCEKHAPTREGKDDDVIRSSAYLSGSAEAGGVENATWCDVVHGRKKLGEAKIERPPDPPQIVDPYTGDFC